MTTFSFRAKRWRQQTIFALACMVMLPGIRASAGTILEFSVGSGGMVGIAFGERHPRLWGRGIKVSDLMYGSHDLRLFSGRLALSGGKFEGSRGNLVWGPGGSFSIAGCADLNHDAKCDTGDFKGKLLTGTLLNTVIVDDNGKSVLEAQIQDQVSPELAALLHLPKHALNGELNLTLGLFDQGRWWRREAVRGGTVTDFGNVTEPSSLFLLVGAGLCVFSAPLWRRLLRVKHRTTPRIARS